MELKLVVVRGKTNKDAVTLNPPVVIGRSRLAELTVAHPMISRRHCEIFEVGGLLMIRDLGSLNGTVVEGQRVRESPLCPGKEFSLGPLVFRAEYQYDGDLDSLPAPEIVGEAPPQPLGNPTEYGLGSDAEDEIAEILQSDSTTAKDIRDIDAGLDEAATEALGETDEPPEDA